MCLKEGDGPVYVVQPEKGGEVRVLHRNHLLPVGEKLEELDDHVEAVEPKPKRKQKEDIVEEKVESESSGSSEDCIVQLLDQQQVLVSMLSSVFEQFQKFNVQQ